MNRILPIALGAMLTLSTASAMAADRPTGTYMGLGLGANIAEDTELGGNGINADVEHETGFAGVVSLGHAYANGFRAEAEFGMRRDGVDSSGSTSTGGRAQTISGMLNGYYDFVSSTGFTPYVGAGIGMGKLDISVDPVGSTGVDDSGYGLALQGIAGVGYQLTDNWTGGLEYRYFTVRDVDLDTRAGGAIDADYGAHTIMVGLRYTFGVQSKPMPAPVPAAAPAPAPAPAPVAQPEPAPAPPPPPVTRNFIVFFDWDQSTITPEARAILESAAENARRGGISRIEATGHADRSGTQRYNLGLSERRARAVQAELGRLGIGTSQIAIDWKGELEPLVPTDDGVREPQNRRVEIVFPQ